MTLECPKCCSKLASATLRVDWFSKIGATACPVCGAKFRLSPPYPLIFLWGSFPVLCFFLFTRGFQQGVLSSVRMVVAWFFGSVIASVYISRVRPPMLKLLGPDKDTPIQLFKKAD